jgi:paired amphipathic helix protein Sin3a
MAPKALALEIEVLHDKKARASHQSKHHGITYPFQLGFSDADLFKDVTRVIYSYIDRQAGYTSSDREKIRTFIQTFIPLCFHVDDVVPENMMHYMEEVEDEELAEDGDDNHSTGTEDSESDMGRNSPRKRSQSPRRRSTRTARSRQEDEHTMDLLRDVLTKNQNALPRFQTPSNEVHPEEQQQEQQTDENGNKLFAAAAVAIAPNMKKRVVYSLFCNTTFYSFFRLYQVKKKKKKKKKRMSLGSNGRVLYIDAL